GSSRPPRGRVACSQRRTWPFSGISVTRTLGLEARIAQNTAPPRAPKLFGNTKPLLEPFDSMRPFRRGRLADGVLVAKEAYLLDRVLKRHRLQPLYAQDTLCKVIVLNVLEHLTGYDGCLRDRGR